MEQIMKLRAQRAEKWEAAKAFLIAKTDADGNISAEDAQAYDKMEAEINALTENIERLERMAEREKALNAPANTPITVMPGQTAEPAKDRKREAFWNVMRGMNLQEDLNTLELEEGGYLVADEFEKTLVEKLQDENIFRTLATTTQTSSGELKIAVRKDNTGAEWTDEKAKIEKTTLSFDQISIKAHKLATIIQVSEELLNDSFVNIEQMVADDYAKAFGAAEEDAFINGDVDGKPTGLLHATEGAEVGVTTNSATAITADELIDLVYSLKAAYRKNAAFLMNDATVKAIRKLKDGNGQYLWQAALAGGEPDRLLNYPIYTSSAMPTIEAGKPVIAFGDFSKYRIVDRVGRTFKRLGELYAENDMVGFKATQRVGGKLTLPEAVKLLKMKA